MSPTRTTQVAFAAALAVSLLALSNVAPAHASAASVIRDCSEDGVLNGNYSQSELDGALEQLPSDLDEYTDCRAVIRSAQLGSAGRKHGAAESKRERITAGPRNLSYGDRVVVRLRLELSSERILRDFDGGQSHGVPACSISVLEPSGFGAAILNQNQHLAGLQGSELALECCLRRPLGKAALTRAPGVELNLVV